MDTNNSEQQSDSENQSVNSLQPENQPMTPVYQQPDPVPERNAVFAPEALVASADGPSAAVSHQSDEPLAVVKVLSVRGLEYWMMTLALWVGAFSLTGVLLAVINGGSNFEVLAFPVSALVVSFALFAFFFLRLKKAELMNPSLRFDPSKRRMSQVTQILAYLAGFVSLIGIVYSIIAKLGGGYDGSVGKLLLDFVVILVVAGGILYYYWVDEHKR